MISIQGYLSKKGKYKWSKRWCCLRRDGYIDYVHSDHKSIKTVDFTNAHIESYDAQKNVIQWRKSNGQLIQFRFETVSIQKEWIYRMRQIQKICKKRREHPRIPTVLKSVYSFTLRHKPNNFRGSSIANEQYFGFDCFENMEMWKECISKSIKQMYCMSTNSLLYSLRPNLLSTDQRIITHLIKMIEGSECNGGMRECIDRIHIALFGDLQKESNHRDSKRLIRRILDSQDDEIFLKMFNFSLDLELDLKKKLIQIIALCVDYMNEHECYRFIQSLTNTNGQNAFIQSVFDRFVHVCFHHVCVCVHCVFHLVLT